MIDEASLLPFAGLANGLPSILAQTESLWDWSLDGWIIATGILCSLSGALLGCFLTLRKLSLLGDAISHAILPGIVGAYWISGSADSLSMWLGAVIVAILTVWLTESARHYGKVEENASTGIVFTGLFAIGILMVVRMDRVDLDLACVLYGDIESTPYDLLEWSSVPIPRAFAIALIVFLLNASIIALFWKEWFASSFDTGLAASLGLRPVAMHYLLATLTAMTSVSSFESVGNILIVAMFVVPPSTAFLLTKKLHWMIVVSCLLAIASAVLGHLAAIHVPRWFGFASTSTAAMMTIVSSIFLIVAILIGPRDGILFKIYERWWLSTKILSEDILATLFRDREQGRSPRSSLELQKHLLATPFRFRLALQRLVRLGWVQFERGMVTMTPQGNIEGQNLVRSHRLWEQYLATQTGVTDQRLHTQAESLEHFTSRDMRAALETETQSPQLDPHGSPIPPEGTENVSRNP